MKASRIGLVFASLLLAGLFSGAAYAACPCIGTTMATCAAESQGDPNKGPNDCSDSAGDLVDTDGQGCIEVDSGMDVDGDGTRECAVCVGGAVQSLHNDGTAPDPDVVLARGCVCVLNAVKAEVYEEPSWTCISTNGINSTDPGANVPAVPPIPPGGGELDDLIEVEWKVSGEGGSWCEMRAEDACSAEVPM